MTDLKLVTFATRKDEVIYEIKQELGSIFSSKLRLGALLFEVKEEMQGMGEGYQVFIEFCRQELGMSEATVCRQIKISKFFKEDERLENLPLYILSFLMKEATTEQIETVAQVAGANKKGLTMQEVHKLLDVKVKVVKPVDKAVVTEEMNDELNEALSSITTKEATPADKQAEIKEQHDTALVEELKAVRELLANANEVIQLLKTEKAEQAVKKSMPMLPQFKSKFDCAVLGLTPEEASKPTLIKKAFRELVKVGYGAGHEAFELLTSTKDDLLLKCKEVS